MRRCFTNLQISCHKLETEIGRYRKNLAGPRFCQIFKSGKVEDDIHFLLLSVLFFFKEMCFSIVATIQRIVAAEVAQFWYIYTKSIRSK